MSWDGGNGYVFETYDADPGPVKGSALVAGLPGVEWDGSTYTLSTTVPPSTEFPVGDVAGSILAVIQLPSVGVGNRNIFGAGWSLMVAHDGVNPVLLVSDGGSNYCIGDDPLTVPDVPYLVELHADDAEWTMWLNGAEIGVTPFFGLNTGEWLGKVLNPGSVSIGTGNGGAGNELIIAELYVASGATLLDVTAKRAALVTKYGL